MARENGTDAALKKAVKLDEDAKGAAKRARKAAKKISDGENNDGENNDGENNDGNNENNDGSVSDNAGKSNDSKNKDAGQKNHVNSVMRMLASGPLSKMAKNIFSSLKINYSANGNKIYGLDHMYNVLLAACMGNDMRRAID